MSSMRSHPVVKDARSGDHKLKDVRECMGDTVMCLYINCMA